METKTKLIEPLLERAEQYGRTSYEILKLKTLDKSADLTSGILSRLLLAVVLSFFTLTLTIAGALWVGSLLGKNYLGFLVIASFYGLATIILLFIHTFIKTRFNNRIIQQMFN